MLEIVPLKKTDIRETPLDTGVVLYNPRTDEAHLLNPAALVVWECCTGEYSIPGIARLLQKAYQQEGDCEHEVEVIVRLFRDKDLLSLLSCH